MKIELEKALELSERLIISRAIWSSLKSAITTNKTRISQYIRNKKLHACSIKIAIALFVQSDRICGVKPNFASLDWRQCFPSFSPYRLALARCVVRAIRNCCNKYGVRSNGHFSRVSLERSVKFSPRNSRGYRSSSRARATRCQLRAVSLKIRLKRRRRGTYIGKVLTDHVKARKSERKGGLDKFR